jgi:hypothetical protein
VLEAVEAVEHHRYKDQMDPTLSFQALLLLLVAEQEEVAEVGIKVVVGVEEQEVFLQLEVQSHTPR